MSRSKRGRQTSPRYEPEPEGPDVEDTLASILDVMVNILRSQVCGECHGTGRMADGQLDGKPNWKHCVCRIQARALLDEFGE